MGFLTHIHSQSYYHHILAYLMYIHSWWHNKGMTYNPKLNFQTCTVEKVIWMQNTFIFKILLFVYDFTLKSIWAIIGTPATQHWWAESLRFSVKYTVVPRTWTFPIFCNFSYPSLCSIFFPLLSGFYRVVKNICCWS